MIPVFLAGGPVMWLLLACSVITLAVIIERALFWSRIALDRSPQQSRELRRGRPLSDAEDSPDPVVRVLASGAGSPDAEASWRMQTAATREIGRACRNLGVLNTMVALAPLLGIFGTVLGIIQSFQLLGEASLADPVAASRGLAQALLTTAFGLAIAMPSLIAFKYFQARAIRLQQEIEEQATALEITRGLERTETARAPAPELQQA